jgi:hypothetical protein
MTPAERETLALEAARLKAQIVYAEELAHIRGDAQAAHGMERPSGFRPASAGRAYAYAGTRSRRGYRRSRSSDAASMLMASGTLAATFFLAAIIAIL